MCELIDKDQLCPANQHRVEVHLSQRHVAIDHRFARNGLDAFGQRIGFPAAMCLHVADDDIAALPFGFLRGLQHCIRLANAGTHAEEHL